MVKQQKKFEGPNQNERHIEMGNQVSFRGCDYTIDYFNRAKDKVILRDLANDQTRQYSYMALAEGLSAGRIYAGLKAIKPKPRCEADMQNHCKVYIPTPNGGLQKVWVRVTSGNKFTGTGIVDQDPIRQESRINGRLIKLGTMISFAGGNEVVFPKATKVLHAANKKEVLVQGIAEQLKRDMTQLGKLQ